MSGSAEESLEVRIDITVPALASGLAVGAGYRVGDFGQHFAGGREARDATADGQSFMVLPAGFWHGATRSKAQSCPGLR